MTSTITIGRVVLTAEEMLEACRTACTRNITNVLKGRVERHGKTRQPWDRNIQGMLGERAASKYLDIPWDPVLDDFGRSDVGGYEIRTTAYMDGKLILHSHDKDDKVFILLTGQDSTFIVRGWLLARDGKQPRYWKNQSEGEIRPAYFVPQQDLRPMLMLPDPN